MDHPLLPVLARETVTRWDFLDRLLLPAWSLDPASGTASYHGRVRITTFLGTRQVHQCLIWQTPPFSIPLPVLLSALWTVPGGPLPGAPDTPEGGGSVVGETSTDGLVTSSSSSMGSWGDGALPDFLGEPDDVFQEAAAAAGDGSIGGPGVPHLVSPTSTLSLVLLSSDTDDS
ncbi:hypothetical protein QL285_032117 [Trifolium repens]|nr:hypothetical protein QL285_032115 [Trifolium repens]KAK2421494.1 hypothetical protein QL285_032117 [Trifolium repens]